LDAESSFDSSIVLSPILPAKHYLFENGHQLTFFCNSAMKLKQLITYDGVHRKQIIRMHVLSRAITNVIFEHSPSPVSSPIDRAMDSGVLRCDFASLVKPMLPIAPYYITHACQNNTFGSKNHFPIRIHT
jgi:hypothetical protein